MNPTLEPLLHADHRCLEAAELLIDTLPIMPSVRVYQALLEEVARARDTAAAFRARGPFEALFLRHLRASWDALEAVARFRFEWPRGEIGTFVAAIGEPDALERLQEVTAGLDQERIFTYLRLRQEYRTDRIPPGGIEVRTLLEATVRRISEAFREWLVAREGPLPGLDARVELGPPQAEKSWYEPARHRVLLHPGEFMIFERDGAVTVNAAVALQSLAHELAGHAVQDALSRDLPDPLRPDHRSRMRFACLPIAEGFAYHRSTLALRFAEECRADLDLEDRDISLLRAFVEMSPLHHAVPALVGAMAARARQDAGFDAAGHLEAVAGHGGFGEMIAALSSDPLNRILYNAACYFGLLSVRRAAAELERKGIGAAAVCRRLGTGGWCLACYPDAILLEEETGR